MKKITFLLLALVLTLSLFAAGQSDSSTQESYELVVMNNGILKFPEAERGFRTAPGIVEKIADDFMRKHPNVTVEMVYRDVSKGSLTYDTMLAAGNPPDVWIDASGYFTNLLNADYAIPMEEYYDLSKYDETLMALYRTDGHQYAIPLVNIATGMVVNISMLRAAGMELPEQKDWTTEIFLEGAEKLKRAGFPATMIQGKEGLNGWTCSWIYAFGARFFAPGDWSKVTINTPEALAALNYIEVLVDRGYTPNPITTTDDMAVQ